MRFNCAFENWKIETGRSTDNEYHCQLHSTTFCPFQFRTKPLLSLAHWEDLLRKLNYYFRIGDKIGAIERKYARMQIHNLRAICLHFEAYAAWIKKKKLTQFHWLLITFDKSDWIQRKIRLFIEDCIESKQNIRFSNI